MLAVLPSTHSVLAQIPERTVVFPNSVPLGMLITRPWDATDEMDWELLAEAKGSITVPAGRMLGLQFNRYLIGSWEPMNSLPPDALNELNLTNAQITEDHLKTVGRLTGIRELALVLTPVQDEWLAHLSGLHQLEILDLGQTKITGTGLSHLAGLSNLRTLGIHSTPISDVAMDSLVQIKSLENVGFNFTQVTSNGLKKLVSLPKLKRFEMMRFADINVCETLSQIETLEEIYFHESDSTTDACLEILSRLPRLRILFVNSAEVTDTGLLAFKASPSLERIELVRSKTTRAGAEALQSAKPQCLIFR